MLLTLGTYLSVSTELDCSTPGWPRGPGWLSVIWADGGWVGRGSFLGVLFARSLDFDFVTCPCTKQELNRWPQSWRLRTCIATELGGVPAILSLFLFRALEMAPWRGSGAQSHGSGGSAR